ncbi:MAG: OmpH family outer membrane protein [Salinivirgaceae bacterium]|nr:OmpH family outer membrane protein [Salinivirgaceae bacterium]MDD4745956.1 OmpH family outer membrane protein [Salinivirgaceae bacterium]MDY0279588.1 OmpH family outer membrane protein [Salinivirgaceae bacterium]
MSIKKLLFVFVLATLASFSFSQRFAYIDTQYILNNIPAYESAQEQLKIIMDEWQEEISTLNVESDRLLKLYEVEKVLLSEDLRKKRLEEIEEKQKEAKKQQDKYFGKDGSFFQKRQELIKPIQDQIFNAIKEIGTEGNFAMVIDIASGLGVVYNDPKYDKSDEVLQKLGYR